MHLPSKWKGGKKDEKRRRNRIKRKNWKMKEKWADTPNAGTGGC